MPAQPKVHPSLEYGLHLRNFYHAPTYKSFFFYHFIQNRAYSDATTCWRDTAPVPELSSPHNDNLPASIRFPKNFHPAGVSYSSIFVALATLIGNTIQAYSKKAQSTFETRACVNIETTWSDVFLFSDISTVDLQKCSDYMLLSQRTLGFTKPQSLATSSIGFDSDFWKSGHSFYLSKAALVGMLRAKPLTPVCWKYGMQKMLSAITATESEGVRKKLCWPRIM